MLAHKRMYDAKENYTSTTHIETTFYIIHEVVMD